MVEFFWIKPVKRHMFTITNSVTNLSNAWKLVARMLVGSVVRNISIYVALMPPTESADCRKKEHYFFSLKSSNARVENFISKEKRLTVNCYINLYTIKT